MNGPGTQPHFWNVPYQRNPFFTGGEETLTHLYRALQTERAAALSQPHGISGLGGIGKTHIALEYAYRYQCDYQALLWVRADSASTLTSEYVALAHLLGLPERDEQDQRIVVEAMLRWFRQNTHWLLILDNIDSLATAEPFIPKAPRGHILFTTRARAFSSIAQRVEVKEMDSDTGALLLLRRASLLPLQTRLEVAHHEDCNVAREISEALGGLPLALDQAGAYIKETPSTLQAYLDLYQRRRQELLCTRGQFHEDHPDAVATTWSLSFEKVEQMSSIAADLLRCCAFPSSDAIPEEMFIGTASKLGPELKMLEQNPLAFDHVISILQRYSLVRRIPDQGLITIHRLVQTVLKDTMTLEQQRQWAEQTLRVINHLFPEAKPAMWQQCQRYLSHVEVCATLIDHYHFAFLEARQLLTKAGSYLEARGQYKQAEFLFRQALEINEKTLSPDNKLVAESLDHLSWVIWRQSKFGEAEALYKRALSIRERIFGRDHPETAQSYDNLAGLYREQQGKDAQSEELQKQAIEIFEHTLGDHTRTAVALDNLGWLYTIQGKYTEGEACFRRALAMNEKVNSEMHLATAGDLFSLGWVLSKLNRDEEAEAFYQRALRIREELVGSEHPDTAQVLQVLGVLYRKQGKLKEAGEFLELAVSIYKKVIGLNNPNTAQAILRLGLIYSDQEKYRQVLNDNIK